VFDDQEFMMKTNKLARVALAFALTLGAGLALAAPEDLAEGCGANSLKAENGQVSVTEDGKTTAIKTRSTKGGQARLASARTSCRSGGGYTVCSNGRHGCVWSDRSGRLLGCGAGI
jgi:hypothetical protein